MTWKWLEYDYEKGKKKWLWLEYEWLQSNLLLQFDYFETDYPALTWNLFDNNNGFVINVISNMIIKDLSKKYKCYNNAIIAK